MYTSKLSSVLFCSDLNFDTDVGSEVESRDETIIQWALKPNLYKLLFSAAGYEIGKGRVAN